MPHGSPRPEVVLLRVEFEGAPSFEMDFGDAPNSYFIETGTAPVVEPAETKLFLSLLNDTPHLIDIGANVGWYSCIAAAHSHGRASVLAFEPEPYNYERLVRNIGHNFFHGVQARRIALEAAQEMGKLYLSPDNPGNHRTSNTGGREAINVPIARLDDVTASTGFHADIVKIDVQGAEPYVFAGATKTFARMGDSLAVFTEFYPAGMGLDVAHALADHMYSFNHPVFVMYPYEGGQLQPIPPEVLHSAIHGCIHPNTEQYINLLNAPKDARVEKIKPFVGRPWQQW